MLHFRFPVRMNKQNSNLQKSKSIKKNHNKRTLTCMKLDRSQEQSYKVERAESDPKMSFSWPCS